MVTFKKLIAGPYDDICDCDNFLFDDDDHDDDDDNDDDDDGYDNHHNDKNVFMYTHFNHTIHMYSGITSGRVLNGELLYTKILEVNLIAFTYRLFRRDFSPLDGTYAMYETCSSSSLSARYLDIILVSGIFCPNTALCQQCMWVENFLAQTHACDGCVV